MMTTTPNSPTVTTMPNGPTVATTTTPSVTHNYNHDHYHYNHYHNHYHHLNHHPHVHDSGGDNNNSGKPPWGFFFGSLCAVRHLDALTTKNDNERGSGERDRGRDMSQPLSPLSTTKA